MFEIQLPPPQLKGKMTVEEALYRRTSKRMYTGEPLTLAQLSQLLWAAQGRSERGLRTIPSAAQTYPLETHVLTGENTVSGMPAGVYAYHPRRHYLEQWSPKDSRLDLAMAASGEESIATAPVDIVIGAVYQRSTRVCGRRGERYVHLEAGHSAQNIYLQATALELGTVVVGLFQEEAVRQVLGLDESYTPLYIMTVGVPV